jgi:hypothetical protein
MALNLSASGTTTFGPGGAMNMQVAGPAMGPYGDILKVLMARRAAADKEKSKMAAIQQEMAAFQLAQMKKAARAPSPGSGEGKPLNFAEDWSKYGHTAYTAMGNAMNGAIAATEGSPGAVSGGYRPGGGGPKSATMGPMSGTGAELSRSTIIPGQDSVSKANAKLQETPATMTPDYIRQLLTLENLMPSAGPADMNIYGRGMSPMPSQAGGPWGDQVAKKIPRQRPTGYTGPWNPFAELLG